MAVYSSWGSSSKFIMHVGEDLIKRRAEACVAGLAWYNSKLKEKSTSEVRSNNNVLCIAYISSVISLSLLASLFYLSVFPSGFSSMPVIPSDQTIHTQVFSRDVLKSLLNFKFTAVTKHIHVFHHLSTSAVIYATSKLWEASVELRSNTAWLPGGLWHCGITAAC